MLNLQLQMILIYLYTLNFILNIEGYAMKRPALLKGKQKKVYILKDPLDVKKTNVIVEGVDSIEKIQDLKQILTITIKENFIDNVTAGIERREKTNTDAKGINILKDIISHTKKLHETIQNINDISILKYITLNMIFGPAGHNEELQIFDELVKNLGNDAVALKLRIGRLVEKAMDYIGDLLSLSDSERKTILSTGQDKNARRDILTNTILGDVGCAGKKINIRQIKSMINDKGKDGNTKQISPLSSDSSRQAQNNSVFYGPIYGISFDSPRRFMFDSISNTAIFNKIQAMDNNAIKELLSTVFGNVQVTEKMINVFTLMRNGTTADIDLLKDVHNISKTLLKLIRQSDDQNSLREIATNMVYATNILVLKIFDTPNAKKSVSQFVADLKTQELDEDTRKSKFFDFMLGGVGCIGKASSQEALMMDNDGIESTKLTNLQNKPIKYSNDIIEYDWPMGIVPYYIDTASYDSIIADRIKTSMKSIETVSCVVFREMTERPNGTYFWVHITNPNNERECVHRMVAGRRRALEMVLGYNCIQTRHIFHSLFHVLGFQDEVTHPQRDSYVRILWNNIQPKYRQLFGIRTPTASKPLVEYDTSSIMHFHDRAFSRNGRATISSLIPGMLISPSEYMSQLDIMKLRLAYGHQCHKQRIYNFYETCKNVLLSKEAQSMEVRQSGESEHSEKEQTPEQRESDDSKHSEKEQTPEPKESDDSKHFKKEQAPKSSPYKVKFEAKINSKNVIKISDEVEVDEDKPKIIELQK